MPSSAPKPCTFPGCARYSINGSRCEKHAREINKQSDAQRGTSSQRGYGHKWRRLSKAFLKRRPTCECEECINSLAPQQAEVVDHIIDHKLKEAKDSGDYVRIKEAYRLFWSTKNWRPMSKAHHDKKTGKQYGFRRR